MSKFIDILRKLGVFRSGSVSGTYTSGKERPTELMIDDVMDAKKDLVNKEDVEKLKTKISDINSAKPRKSSGGRKALFIIVLLLGAFLILGQLASGFSISLLITLAIWVVFFVYLKKFAYGGYYSFGLMVIISIIVIFISLMMVPSSGSSGDSSGGTKNLTDANFDRKVLNVTSTDGTVKGTIGLVKKKNKQNKEYLSATYNLLLKASLPWNANCDHIAGGGNADCGQSYEYGGRLVPVDKSGEKDGNGVTSAVYCNKDKLATDPYSASGTGHTLKDCGLTKTNGLKTDTFVSNFATNFYSYAEILKTTEFEMYNISKYWEPTEGEAGSYTSNVDKAVQETSPVKILHFIVSE